MKTENKLSAKTMLAAVSLRYPVVFVHICQDIDIKKKIPKTNERIGFLIPENIRIDILFMSLAYVVSKLFVNMLIFIYFGGHLGFRHFRRFLDL